MRLSSCRRGFLSFQHHFPTGGRHQKATNWASIHRLFLSTAPSTSTADRRSTTTTGILSPADDRSAEVIIIGGGIIGTSVAYHLGHALETKGERVLLLEASQLTAGTTWHAAGLINTFGSLSHTSTSMRQYTKELYRTILPAETGLETGYRDVGFIELACDVDRLHYYRRVAAFNRLLCGVNVTEITPAQVQERFPLIDTVKAGVLAGFWVPDDGRVNPVDACLALAKGARMQGVQIREGVRVTGVTTAKDSTSHIPRVTGVTLEDGDVIQATRAVVNCAGMWGRQLGQACGVYSIPNQAAEHYYLITDDMPQVDPFWPVVEDSSRCVYVRPEGAGLMLGFFEWEGAAWQTKQVPSQFAFGEIEPDWDRMGPYLERAMELVPATVSVGAKKLFCGPESFTPDNNPIVGEAPELRNYYVAAGLNSIGILTGGGELWL